MLNFRTRLFYTIMDKLDDSSGSAGGGGSSSGTDDNNKDDNKNKDEKKPDTVTREAYDRVLGEKKKAKERLDALEKKEKDREEAESLKRGEHEKVLGERDKELSEMKEREKLRDARDLAFKKKIHFMRTLDVDVKDEYINSLADYNSIQVDDDGNVDETSVQNAVSKFKETYPEIVKKPVAGMPNGSPQGGGGQKKYTQAEYDALPLAEMKKVKMADIL